MNDIRLDNAVKTAWVTYSVGLAENGFLFGEYDIGFDQYKVCVAKDAAELKKLILQWQQRRLEQIIIWAKEKQETFEIAE